MLPQSTRFVRWGEPSQGEILEVDETKVASPDLMNESGDASDAACPFDSKTRSDNKKSGDHRSPLLNVFERLSRLANSESHPEFDRRFL